MPADGRTDGLGRANPSLYDQCIKHFRCKRKRGFWFGRWLRAPSVPEDIGVVVVTRGAQGEALLPRQCSKHTQAGGGGKRGRSGANARTHEHQCAPPPPRPHERQTVGGLFRDGPSLRNRGGSGCPQAGTAGSVAQNPLGCVGHTDTHAQDAPPTPLPGFALGFSVHSCVTCASLHFRHVISFL